MKLPCLLFSDQNGIDVAFTGEAALDRKHATDYCGTSSREPYSNRRPEDGYARISAGRDRWLALSLYR